MSLEFNKIVAQVQTMGRYFNHRNTSVLSKLDIALALFYATTDLENVRARIDFVRQSSVSGYRGAAALQEIISQTYSAPSQAPIGTVIAADGSQIYPDQHAPNLYYLINIGVFIRSYDQNRIPDQATYPTLYYSESDINDADGRTVSNVTVNARRSVEEMSALAREAWEMRDHDTPLITLHDGGLLKFFGANEVANARKTEENYLSALQQLRDSRALLAGYLDRSRSKYLISLLHLLTLEPEQITDANLKTNGELEGLTDDHLMRRVLKPGERSAIMVQNSPQNHEYMRRLGQDFEIAFFYLNVSHTQYPIIARIDIPMWVAKSPAAVDALHSLLLAECAIQGRRRYPYAITRADELAVVNSAEKNQLNDLISIVMRENEVEHESSNKLQTKGLARGTKRQHKLGS